MIARTMEKVEFDGGFGDRLAARLDLPEGEIRAYALFAHCFTCSKDVFAASRIAQGLAGGSGGPDYNSAIAWARDIDNAGSCLERI